jgi:hypothetical protein
MFKEFVFTAGVKYSQDADAPVGATFFADFYEGSENERYQVEVTGHTPGELAKNADVYMSLQNEGQKIKCTYLRVPPEVISGSGEAIGNMKADSRREFIRVLYSSENFQHKMY